ncbi:hypothetical protein H4219_005012 [Mycoemilia scoparia]|uniref:Uncharacterized protein n=1 Tax=Mycoemilia scoparia TaxID=417184 RepID=A0A9W7ZQL6_9FUNG|nr:hypothetical protein H4219_005012 [Mycoemilia scoparia]
MPANHPPIPTDASAAECPFHALFGKPQAYSDIFDDYGVIKPGLSEGDNLIRPTDFALSIGLIISLLMSGILVGLYKKLTGSKSSPVKNDNDDKKTN